MHVFGLVGISIEFSTGYLLRFLRNVLVFEKSLVKAFKSPLRRVTVRRARDQRLYSQDQGRAARGCTAAGA